VSAVLGMAHPLHAQTPSPAPASESAPEAPSELRGHGGPVRALAALGSGQTLVTGGFDSALIVWQRATGSAQRVLRHHASTVNALVALPGNCFASGGEDGDIALWCEGQTTPTRVLKGHLAPITSLAVSPDGSQLASTSFDRTVKVWPLTSNDPPRTLEGGSGPTNAVAFSRHRPAVVTGGYDGTLALRPLDASDASPVPRPLSLGVPVNALAIAPDGHIVMAGADGHVRRFTPDLEPIADLDVGSGPLTTLAVSPDGTQIATAGMRTQVTLIDVASGKTAFEILGPGLPVWALAFSPDGRELYTGGQDRAVRRWVAATGKPAGRDVAALAAPTLPFPDERGAQLFRACVACHGVTPADTNRAGPSLAGLFGRRIATAPGYVYSDALKGMDIIWTPETVAELFTVGPNAYTPGTKMPEQTLTSPDDRAALTSWLAKATAE
jgi:cytochrome c